MPDTEQWDTMTRSQILTERDYPDDIIASNGSTPAIQRQCAICHVPVSADRPKNSRVCGKDECVKAWRLAQRRVGMQMAGSRRRQILELVSRTGAELVSVELIVDGERWRLVRN